MRIAQIKQLFRIIGGKPAPKGNSAFSDEGTPFIKMKDLGRAHFSNNLVDIDQRVSDTVAKKEGLNLIRRGSILLPRSGSVALNHRAVLGIDAYMVSHICALEVIDPKEVSNLYAYYYLRSIKMDRISKKTTGLDAITFEDLGKVSVPLPGIDDQIRIAHLLGKVEGLIAQRKQHVQQLDDLLKSVFLEMFGDPILNPHGFPVGKLSEFYVNPKEGTKCGPFGSALKKEELVDAGVPVWNMDNIASGGRMALPFRMWITAGKYDELAAYSVKDGDIIVSRAGTVGKMCVARMNEQPAIISTNLIRVRLGDRLRPLHFVSLMLYCKGRVGRLKTGADGAFTHMNTGVLDSLEFPYPSIELQDQFAAVVEKVEAVKSRYQQSLTDLEALYGALSQQAFKGELDLSRVALLTAPIEGESPVATAVPAPITTPVIELPETDLLLPALQDSTQLAPLLRFWLEAYRTQLGSAAFSLERFIAAAQTRLAELHPDNDFEWAASDYEYIKAWVFEALAAGALTQAFDDDGNRIELRAAAEQSLA